MLRSELDLVFRSDREGLNKRYELKLFHYISSLILLQPLIV